MPEGVNAKVEVLFAHSLSAFAVAHLRNNQRKKSISLRASSTPSLGAHLEKDIHRSSDPRDDE